MSISSNTVSVIIPAWNCRSWIAQCLDSVRCQTHENIEIVIVYGYSSDSTDEWISNHARDCVLVNSNSHLTAGQAILMGLKNATGEFIFFLDSDDWLPENAIESLLAVFHDRIDVVFAQCLHVYGENFYPSANRLIPFRPRHLQTAWSMLHTCLFRSSFLAEILIHHREFISSISYVYDLMFAVLALVESPYGICRIENDVYYYRQRIDSGKRLNRQNVIDEIKSALEYSHAIQKNRTAHDRQSGCQPNQN